MTHKYAHILRLIEKFVSVKNVVKVVILDCAQPVGIQPRGNCMRSSKMNERLWRMQPGARVRLSHGK